MSFSFNTTAGASQSSTKSRLAGNDIYDVKFDGCEIVDIKGVKEPDKIYKVLKLKFSNEEGTFEHTVFEPRPEDFTRGESEYTTKEGKKEKIPQASGVENIMLLFKHAIDSIAPAIGKEIDNGTKNLGAADWNGLRTLVAKILDSGKDKEFQIKLLKNNKGEATFPGFFSGITKEGKAYVRNNFIGTKLAFSTYEITRINNEATAKPTSVSSYATQSKPAAAASGQGNDLNMDFDLPIL